MKLASVRVVTQDVDRLASFYGWLTGVAATRLTPEFAEVRVQGAVLAVVSERSVKQFNVGAAIAAANRSAIIEFQVQDVDALLIRLQEAEIDPVMPPTDQPWGNRSMLMRDPDGTLINIFAPIGHGN